jgi:hypothetical protein
MKLFIKILCGVFCFTSGWVIGHTVSGYLYWNSTAIQTRIFDLLEILR